MHPDLEKLVILQRLDLELRKLREEVAAQPARIATLAARSAEAQATLLSLEETIVREDAKRRALELEITTITDRATRLRDQSASVTNEAQATALEHEIIFAAAEVKRLEDEQISSMERTEAADAALPTAREAQVGTENILEQTRITSGDRAEYLNSRIAELAVERDALRPTIDESPLSTYDRISKSRGTAVAEGTNQKCSACQMLIRPQRWNDIRDRSQADAIFTCESCGRMLFWDPANDAPQPKVVAPAAKTSGSPARSAPATTSARTASPRVSPSRAAAQAAALARPGAPKLGETKAADDPKESIAARIVRGG